MANLRHLDPRWGKLIRAGTDTVEDVGDEARRDWERAAGEVLRRARRLPPEAPDDAVWSALAQTTVEGITVPPLGVPSADGTFALPRPVPPGRGWDVRVLIRDPDPGRAATSALADLEGGAHVAVDHARSIGNSAGRPPGRAGRTCSWMPPRWSSRALATSTTRRRRGRSPACSRSEVARPRRGPRSARIPWVAPSANLSIPRQDWTGCRRSPHWPASWASGRSSPTGRRRTPPARATRPSSATRWRAPRRTCVGSPAPACGREMLCRCCTVDSRRRTTSSPPSRNSARRGSCGAGWPSSPGSPTSISSCTRPRRGR